MILITFFIYVQEIMFFLYNKRKIMDIFSIKRTLYDNKLWVQLKYQNLLVTWNEFKSM